MELYQLRTFAAVAECGTLARAAERIHVSQPAASAQIKALEEEFGVALFLRKPRGLTLTRAGVALLASARRLLALAADISEEARHWSGEVHGRIRFGAFFDPTLLRLGELMHCLVSRHPMLEIEIRHQNSRAVIAGVRSGDLDCGMALAAAVPDGLAGLPLARLRYRIVAPGKWAARVRGASWKAIAALPWISTPRDGSHYQMARQIFTRYRFEPAHVIEGDSEAIITSLVYAGVGLGLMREDLARQAQAEGNAVVLEKGEAQTQLQLLYPAARAGDAAMRALVTAVREVWSLDSAENHAAARSPAAVVALRSRK